MVKKTKSASSSEKRGLGDARYNLAANAHTQGRLDEAFALYRDALQADPNHAPTHGMLGVLLQQRGQAGPALDHMRRAIELDPSCAGFFVNLGALLQGLGDSHGAEDCYRRALMLDPDIASAHGNLAAILRDAGRHEEAFRCAKRSLELQPTAAQSHHIIGNLFDAQGRHADAETAYRNALAIDPSLLLALFDLAENLRLQGKLRESLSFNQQAAMRYDKHAPGFNSLGLALQEAGDLTGALKAFEAGIAIAPTSAPLLANAGAALAELDRPADAVHYLQRAIEQAPKEARFWSNLGNALNHLGETTRGIAAYRHALKLTPNDASLHSNLIFSLDLCASRDVAVAERRTFGKTFAARQKSHAFAQTRDPDRPLKIGYVSGDFRRHSAAEIFMPIVLGHDTSQFDVTLYSTVIRRDAGTEMFEQLAQTMVPCARMTTEEMCNVIRRDQIDILVDLSGHSEGNRMLVFAEKPTPIQVTAWGHALGTGLNTMDYFFADAFSVPKEEMADFVEEVLYLPALFCFARPIDAPEVSPQPALSGAPFTFGCFNRIEKLSDGAIALWARVLHRMPASRLLLKSRGLDDPPISERILSRFATHGIGPERLWTMGRTTQKAHFEALSHVDLGLEPFPHGGGTSTVESFHMGVPILTRVGRGIVERQGAAFCYAVGLDEFVTDSDDAFVEAAVRFASDVQHLSRVRASLRAALQASPLCDAPAYVRSVEEKYRWMWHRWLNAQDGLSKP